MFERPEVMHQRIIDNKKVLLKSKLIAKAVIRSGKQRTDGTYPLIVLAVYEKSTTYEFYWKAIIDSTSPRAPRKKWLKHIQAIKKNYADFRDFVNVTAKLEKAEIVSFRIINKKKLNSVMLRCHMDSLSNNWHEAPQVVTSADVRYVQQRAKVKQRGTLNGWGS